MASFLLLDEVQSSEALGLATDQGVSSSAGSYSGLPEFDEFLIERRAHRAVSSFGGTWMLTLTDLTMLIFAFFVLLYAMQTPISSSLKASSTALSRGAKITFEDIVLPPDATLNAVAISRQPINSQTYIARVIEASRQSDPRLGKARVQIFDGDIHISFPDQAFFNTGSARVSQDAIPQIVALSRILSTIRNQIVVEISTQQSSLSPLTGRPSTDWSTSLSQGAALARAFRIAGYKPPLAVTATFSASSRDMAMSLNSKTAPNQDFRTQSQGKENEMDINITPLASKSSNIEERAQSPKQATAAHVTLVLKPYHHESS